MGAVAPADWMVMKNGAAVSLGKDTILVIIFTIFDSIRIVTLSRICNFALPTGSWFGF